MKFSFHLAWSSVGAELENMAQNSKTNWQFHQEEQKIDSASWK